MRLIQISRIARYRILHVEERSHVCSVSGGKHRSAEHGDPSFTIGVLVLFQGDLSSVNSVHHYLFFCLVVKAGF